MSVPKRLKFLTKTQVAELTGYTPQHLLKKEKEGTFPKRVVLCFNRHGKHARVGYVEEEVHLWMSEKIAERDASSS